MYVRIRGKSVGPLDDEKVQELIRQGKISKVSEVSSDGQQWVRASEYGGLFTASKDAFGDDLRLTDGLASSNRKKSSSAVPSDGIATTEKPAAEDCVWFYSMDGRSGFGPLTRSEIGVLIRNGTLAPDSLLWKQGEMADTVRYTADFAEFLIPANEAASSKSLPKPPDSSANKKKSSQKQIVWEVLRAAPWIMFLAIIASIAVAAISLGLLGTLCFGFSRLSFLFKIISVCVVLGMIVIMIRPLLKLWNLQSAISQLAVEQTDEKLRNVLRCYYRIFRSLVVHILAFFLLTGVAFLLFATLAGRVFDLVNP